MDEARELPPEGLEDPSLVIDRRKFLGLMSALPLLGIADKVNAGLRLLSLREILGDEALGRDFFEELEEIQEDYTWDEEAQAVIDTIAKRDSSPAPRAINRALIAKAARDLLSLRRKPVDSFVAREARVALLILRKSSKLHESIDQERENDRGYPLVIAEYLAINLGYWLHQNWQIEPEQEVAPLEVFKNINGSQLLIRELDWVISMSGSEELSLMLEYAQNDIAKTKPPFFGCDSGELKPGLTRPLTANTQIEPEKLAEFYELPRSFFDNPIGRWFIFSLRLETGSTLDLYERRERELLLGTTLSKLLTWPPAEIRDNFERFCFNADSAEIRDRIAQVVLLEMLRHYDPNKPFIFSNSEEYEEYFGILESNLLPKSKVEVAVKLIESCWKIGLNTDELGVILAVAERESLLFDTNWGEAEFEVTRNQDGTVSLKRVSENTELSCFGGYPGARVPAELESYNNLLWLATQNEGLTTYWFYASEDDLQNQKPCLKIETPNAGESELLPDRVEGIRTGPRLGSVGEKGVYQIHPSWEAVGPERAEEGVANYAQHFPEAYRLGKAQTMIAAMILGFGPASPDFTLGLDSLRRVFKDWNPNEEWVQVLIDNSMKMSAWVIKQNQSEGSASFATRDFFTPQNHRLQRSALSRRQFLRLPFSY